VSHNPIHKAAIMNSKDALNFHDTQSYETIIHCTQ